MKINDKIIEQKLNQAIKAATPNVLPQILQTIESKKEGGTEMTTTDFQSMPKTLTKDIKKIKPGLSWIKWTASVAAVFMIAFTAYFINSYYTPQAVIAFDVNPSIELKVNKSERVLDAIPLNKEAEIIIGEMNLKRVDLDTAVNALIGSMVKNGYIDEIKNSILISVDSKDEQVGIQLQERLSAEINGLLNEYAVNGAVLSQRVSEDKRIKDLADKYNLSYGKAALIDLLVSQENNLQYGDLAKLSINDINLLIAAQQAKPQGISTSGQVSSKAYIGENKAKSTAINFVKVDESAIRLIKVKMDYEDGRMIYDVEFHTSNAEHEFEIDAITGEILKYDYDENDDDRYVSPDRYSDTPTSSSNNNDTRKYIGKDAAKSIAFKHANVTDSSVRDLEAELDREDGRIIYEVDFKSGNMEYEYDIDAYTGEILKYDHEYDEDDDRKISSNIPANTRPSSSNNNSKNTTSTGTSTGKQTISKDAAKNTAFKHANIIGSSIRDLKVELDEDDGHMVYEVDFESGNMEYEYDIDAYTGEILKWEAGDD